MRAYIDILSTTILTIFLTIILLWPTTQPPAIFYSEDKFAHIVAFAVLSFPLSFTRRFKLLIVFVGTCSFGGIIELVQPFFNRTSEIWDWMSDILGVLIGIFFGVSAQILKTD